jgi:ribosomal protein S18 acetylase RimI-like enzyme
MKDQLGVTIETFAKLSKKKLTIVKQFVARCKKSDGYAPVFYWNSIEDRKNPGINEILCYAANETLVAYVALYHFDEDEIEMTMAVDVAYRKPEFYTLLWEQVKNAVSKCPIEITRFVFTLNEGCTLFKEFLNGLGARIADTTYKLALTAKDFAKIKATDDPKLSFRKAIQTDIPALLALEVNAFQVSEVDYKRYLLEVAEDSDKEILLAIKNGKIIGKVHTQMKKQSAYLYDVAIDADEHGNGYGTSLVYRALTRLFEQSCTKVLVEAMNESHLTWYESFRFKLIATFEHWKMAAHLSPMKEREKQLDAILLNFHSQPVQDQLSQTFYKH